MAAGQVPNNTTAEPARVVCVKPKHLSKKPAAPVKAKNVLPSNASGILPLPSGKNSNHGIVIKESVGHASKVSPPLLCMGKGKVSLWCLNHLSPVIPLMMRLYS